MAKKSLGIEVGSTRIKAVLLNGLEIEAKSDYKWENKYINGYWTYDLKKMWQGIAKVFEDLCDDYKSRFNKDLDYIDQIGISAMMHGYLAFDKDGNLLAPFRTWRNTNTDQASEELTELFKFNIPHRWSVAHLYQAILNKEEHTKNIAFLTTLSGYIHWMLTGEKVLGVGDASGMFPINQKGDDYDLSMIEQFNNLIIDKVTWKLENLLPKVKLAGQNSGFLLDSSKILFDKKGILKNNPQFCPPEGDAGTGMVSTNSIRENTGNVSAGTSIFLMLVLDKALKNYYREVDMVTTPSGKHTAMIHCNNFTSDINNWVSLFSEIIKGLNFKVENKDLFEYLFRSSLNADEKEGNLISCNFHAGEPILQLQEGRPLLIQQANSVLNVSNFMKAHIFSALATLRIGTDMLRDNESLNPNYIIGHGGFFKTELVGQKYMSQALDIPVSVLESAGEGGAWGIALLASYLEYTDKYSLEDYLDKIVFGNLTTKPYIPTPQETKEYKDYLQRYKKMIEVEKSAIKNIV